MEKYCITLGRQFGSGGREAAEKLSKILNIKYYDKEILELASKESGYIKEVFENVDEKREFSFSENILSPRISSFGNFYNVQDSLSADALFKHKMDAIKKIAAEESCIIVGRCADYILRDNENLIRVFISCNNFDLRCARVRSRHPEIEEKNIEAYIKKTDKRRSDYYNYYTDKIWGEASNYDLTIDTGRFGVDVTTEIIADAVKKLIK